MKNFSIVFSFILFSVALHAQQIDKIGKKGGIKVNGGVGLSNQFYFADGIENRQNPYSYVLSGNVNLSLYGFSLPFSFAFSNQNFSYRQPFNIYGLSPSYKNFTFHLGFRSMSFSPYTLGGHNFFGGGIDYKGKKISVTAMSGRLLKAVEYDTSNANVLPAFERWGGGGKVTYRFEQDEISVISFYAKDKLNSISIVPTHLGLTPQENMVWSIAGKKSLFKKLTLQAEVAQSAWTRDIRTESASKSEDLLANLYFMPWKQSTVTYNAIKANATYNFGFMNVGAGYEKIDPEYRTLGAYYFNNDLENITLNFSTGFFKKKISLSANGGLQRDDLRNTKASAMKRKVGSVTMGINPTNRLNFNLSYSNFSSFVNVKPVEDRLIQNTIFNQIDTLNFTQVSQTASVSAGYKISENDDVSRNINVSSSLMTASNEQGTSNIGNQMINGSVVLSQMWKKSGFNMGVNTNANRTAYELGNNVFIGAGINIGKPLFQKKLRASLGINLNQNLEKNNLVARIYSVSNSYSMRIKKKHAFSAALRYSGRAKVGDATLGRYNNSFNEFMGTIAYNFNF